ncbi:hypothetical protein BP6252_04551 [Coleophoma cylindrospora]|uniref:Hydrophobin n=1 Tax=Coleophoma cylindrospora TaxID=1849047 RepID=A0A3D8S0S7_9HELO|nr:hypothetical protein BP6252_04551 [Coleophoma cylindrospora]
MLRNSQIMQYHIISFLLFSPFCTALPFAGLLEDLDTLLGAGSCPSSLNTLLTPLIPKDLLSGLSPLLNNPPSLLVTNTTRAEQPICNPVNQGTLLCCDEALSGDQKVVVGLAQCLNYGLNGNAINGFGCSKSTSGSCKGYELPLCCQTLTL